MAGQNLPDTINPDMKIKLDDLINLLKADILSLFIPGPANEVARTMASAGASIPQLMLSHK
jgi:hypothetical protein